MDTNNKYSMFADEAEPRRNLLPVWAADLPKPSRSRLNFDTFIVRMKPKPSRNEKLYVIEGMAYIAICANKTF